MCCTTELVLAGEYVVSEWFGDLSYKVSKVSHYAHDVSSFKKKTCKV